MSFTVFVAARPIKTAFLIPEETGTNAMCDGLVRWSHETWGGRLSAVALVEKGGTLAADAWDELQRFDPDQVYSFSPLPHQLLPQLDETLAPLLIAEPERARLAPKPGIESAPAAPIASADSDQWAEERFRLPGISVPPTKLNLAQFRDRPLLLFNFGKGCPAVLRRFVHRNLGAYQQWLDLRSGEPRLFSWMEDLVAGSPVKQLRVDDVGSLCSAMEQISGTRAGPSCKSPLSFTAPCELPSMYLPRPFSHGAAYRVVVGSGVQDFALYWRSCVNEDGGVWSAPFRHCLWVPAEVICEEPFVAALKTWLYHFSGQGSSGNWNVELVSTSLAEASLVPLAEMWRKGPWLVPTRIVKPAEIEARWHRDRSRHRGPPRRIPRLNGDNAERLLAVERWQTWELRPPEVIQAAVPTGAWAADVQIEREAREGGLPGQDWWWLPRRGSRSLVASMFHAPARISRDGLFTVRVERSSPWPNMETPARLQLELPADEDVLHRTLVTSREPWFDHLDIRGERLKAVPAVLRIGLSDAGRKLRGLIELFGGFWRAHDYWARAFWRSLFSQMSGRGARSEANLRTQTEQTVEKELARLVQSVPKDERRVVACRIAQRVLGGVIGERLPGGAMTFAEMETERDWFEQLHGYQKQAGLAGETDSLAGHNAVYMHGVEPVTKEDLTQGLEELVELGALRMGVDVVCPRCRLKEWMAIGALQQLNTCRGCNAPALSVPETPWSYRLNPLVHQCVNSRVLAVWLALAELANQPGSFFFTPSSELHFAQPINGGRKKELDVLCVTDGELLLGEVKAGDLHASDFEDFAKVAQVVRPDRAAVFVSKEHLSSKAEKWFEQFSHQLVPLGVRGELFSLPDY
jgi:hypothetical protein